MNLDRPVPAAAPLVLVLLLGACAATPPGASTAAQKDALACNLPSNCVSSIDGAPPLRFDGSADQALQRLRATLTGFSEARVLRADGLVLEVEFTTLAGFKDRVDFRIDPVQQRVDYRSRSTFGLYDFGKNRSRMQDFAQRFAATQGR